MKNVEIQFFEQAILDFFKRNGRKTLPWRKPNISAYEVWVSEVMLQQTQVSRVIDYYNNFLKKFSSIEKLAQAQWEEFLPYYAGLGYYRRGKNMLKTAQIIVEKFGGEFPKDKKTLQSLPGIGDYTASAIMSFAYGEKYLAFDTNVQRVLGRFFYGTKYAKLDKNGLDQKFYANMQRFPNSKQNRKNASQFNKATLTKNDARNFNAAIMDFANDICQNNPKCSQCPMATKCLYNKENGQNEFRKKTELQKTVRKNFPTKKAKVFLYLHRDHREYYSPNPDRFEIFKLDAKTNTRDKIKTYFQKKYGLEVAVRPPHKKIYVNETPTLVVNAQILLGEHNFGIFSKNEVKASGDMLK